MSDARCARRLQRTEHTDGQPHHDPLGPQGRQPDRPLAAAARSPRQGLGPRRIHPQSAPARHAVRQDLPQHGRAWPHQVDRRQRRAEGSGRVPGRHDRRHPHRHPASLLRPGIPRPADPGDGQGALRRRAGRGCAGIRSACRRARRAGDLGRIRGAAGDLRRARGDDLEGLCARRAQARRRLRGPQASHRPQGDQYRARLQAAARRRREGVRRGRPCVRAHVPHPEGAAPRVRAVRLGRRRQAQRGHDLHVVAGPVVRAGRDRAPARHSGEPRAHPRALRGRRLRLQAVHQAGSAGDRAVAAGAAAGQDRAHDGRAVLPDHQAPLHVPHQERARQGWPHHRAQVRGVLERWRLCGRRPAGDAEIRLHRVGAVRHRACPCRLVRALHQRDAGRRLARLRHPATGVGL